MTSYSSLRRRPFNIPSHSTLSYSSDGIVYIEKLNLRTSPSSTARIQAVRYLVAHARVSYSEAISAVGSRLNGRALQIADICVPLQALRIWATKPDYLPEIGHVFSQEHLYVIARILAMVYEQERIADIEYSVFLSLPQLFGQPSKADSKYSLHVLHRMYKMARDNLGDVFLLKYLEHTHKDDEVERLEHLSQGRPNLFHILPLHPDGMLQEEERELIPAADSTNDGWSYVKIHPFDPFPHDSMVYLRGNYEIVTVTLSGSRIFTNIMVLPDSFWEVFGNLRRKGKNGQIAEEEEEEENVEGLDMVIRDANAGNIWAASYLLSQTLQRRIIGTSEIPSGLKLSVLNNLFGILYSYGGDYIIPAAVDESQWPAISWDSSTGSYEVSWLTSTEDGEVWSTGVDIDGDSLIK